MEYILSGEEMKACDSRTIAFFGVPSAVLMERAALACADVLCGEESAFDLTSVLAVCGSGNNGGDGFAAARILHERGVPVTVLFVGNEEKRTQETKLQQKICENYGINICRNTDLSEYTCIVDALFGVGLSREVSGTYREWIEKINESKAKVLCVDVPSGVCADDGRVLGCAVKGDVTVTFGFRKLCHLLYPGAELCGKVLLADIGITERSLEEKPKARAVAKDCLSWMPKRRADSNKGTYGRALIAAGTKNMSGAAYMAAKAAYRIGTGLVRILTEECNRLSIQTLLPEAVMDTLSTEADAKEPCREDSYTALGAAHWAKAVCIGPGYGTRAWKKRLMEQMIHGMSCPLVLDADALNLLADTPEYLDTISVPVIITPHPGEMARLLHTSVEEVTADPAGICLRFAGEHRVICVLKGARTVISDGETLWINETGNHGMATGGAGDVLAGIITGLLAQGCQPLPAAILGVYVHGLAGNAAKKENSARGMLAGEIIEGLKTVLGTERV